MKYGIQNLVNAPKPTPVPEVQRLARMGIKGDTEMAHLTPGEMVIPESAQTPGIKALFAKEMRRQGRNPNKYVVGSSDSAVNPYTRAPQYADDAQLTPQTLNDLLGISAIANVPPPVLGQEHPVFEDDPDVSTQQELGLRTVYGAPGSGGEQLQGSQFQIDLPESGEFKYSSSFGRNDQSQPQAAAAPIGGIGSLAGPIGGYVGPKVAQYALDSGFIGQAGTDALVSGGFLTPGNAGPGNIAGSSLTPFGSAAVGGIASFGLGVLMGQDPKDAAIGAAGSAVGTAIGTAIGGPIGGFIGGAIGGGICFAGNTELRMKNGTKKLIQNIEIMDEIELGGKVFGVGKALSDDLYEFNGERATGSHAVFHENVWMRLRDVPGARKLDDVELVFPVVCENHLMVVDGFISADFAEVDGSEFFNEDQRVMLLNMNEKRNEELEEYIASNQTVQRRVLPRSDVLVDKEVRGSHSTKVSA